MNLKADFKLLAYIMLFIDAILLIPTGMAAYYGETESLKAFIQTEVMILIFCLLIILFTRKVKILRNPHMGHRNGIRMPAALFHRNHDLVR